MNETYKPTLIGLRYGFGKQLAAAINAVLSIKS